MQCYAPDPSRTFAQRKTQDTHDSSTRQRLIEERNPISFEFAFQRNGKLANSAPDFLGLDSLEGVSRSDVSGDSPCRRDHWDSETCAPPAENFFRGKDTARPGQCADHVLLAILRELRLPTLQRDRSQIIIETLHTGSLDQLRDQSREEVRVSADPGESLREGVAREALTVI